MKQRVMTLYIFLMVWLSSIYTAFAVPVTVRFNPSSIAATVGQTFSVDMVADIPFPVLGFGLKVSADSTKLLLNSTTVGPLWFAGTGSDPNDIVGLTFPTSISGANILLATLSFTALNAGATSLVVSFDPSDLAEGFPLELGRFADVKFVDGIVTLNADTIPPVITVSSNPATLWPPNGKMVPVTVSGMITDAGSGVQAGTLTYAVSDEYGSVQPSGPVTLGGNGGYTFTIKLQASRDGNNKDGRKYTITVSAKDQAGNQGSASTVVTVPHDQGK